MLKTFYLKIVLQVLLIALTCLCLAWALQKGHLWFTCFNLLSIVVAQIIFLLWHINKINRDLTRFFEACNNHDTTLFFNNKKDKAFEELYRHFNKIMACTNELLKEREKERFFYQSTIHHVNVGLIAFDDNGNVALCNKTAERIFGHGPIKHITKLNEVRDGLAETICSLTHNRKDFFKLYIKEESVLLSVRCIQIKLEDKNMKLVSFQDIKFEIEQDETEAWQRLIRTLNHEIMNSVSPITLTTSGLINLFEKDNIPRKASELSADTIPNTILGLNAIRKRSKGLAKFVEGYRDITSIPQPHFTRFDILSLFKNIEMLMSDEFKSRQIKFGYEVYPTGAKLLADEKLIEQVLLNLLRNALQALEHTHEACIEMKAYTDDGAAIISVKDNGPGIPPENIQNIFIPFFTTKPQGSGIGLSLSRQIMRLHSGTISVRSVPGAETIFTLKFQCPVKSEKPH